MAGRDNDRRSGPNPWALAGAGLELAAVVAVLTILGRWVDQRWGTEPWLMITGLVIGFIGGFYNLWRLAQRHQ